jgi:hypothetical protein
MAGKASTDREQFVSFLVRTRRLPGLTHCPRDSIAATNDIDKKLEELPASFAEVLRSHLSTFEHLWGWRRKLGHTPTSSDKHLHKMPHRPSEERNEG